MLPSDAYESSPATPPMIPAKSSISSSHIHRGARGEDGGVAGGVLAVSIGVLLKAVNVRIAGAAQHRDYGLDF
ncbi:hypothetical protein AB0B63_26195 [Micromonospora sp. NPDC049081]|uniref:hypothetical protein n=1 Tax=Micromonospora sp. NPDC049081 TaxID=3155150 RepID=UPI0033C4FEE3